MKLHDGLQNPAQITAQHIEDTITRGRDVLFLSAGGSSLSVLNHVHEDIIEKTNLTAGVLDERFTTKAKNNNFSQLITTRFGRHMHSTEPKRLIDTSVSVSDTMEAVADRLRQGITGWRNHNPDGLVIVLVGVGEDGHIAGMIPTENPVVFKRRFCGEQLVVGFEDESLHNDFSGRITTTVRFFRRAVDQAFVYAVGARKCSTLQRLSDNSQPIAKFPANILLDTPARLFTDCPLENG